MYIYIYIYVCICIYIYKYVALFWYLKKAPEHEIRKLPGQGHGSSNVAYVV